MKNTFMYALAGFLSLACLEVSAQTIKIGHTKIDYILSQTDENKIITNLMSIQQTQAQNELKRLQTELQDKYAVYQKDAAQLTDPIRKARESELQSLQARIQEFSRNSDAAIQSKYKQLVSPTLAKIQQAIDIVAKQNGYTHIINTGNSTDILYASEENNITDLVLKQMDSMPAQQVGKPGAAPPKSVKRPIPKTAKKK